MKKIRFDFNNMFDFSVGKKHGVQEEDLTKLLNPARKAHEHLVGLIGNARARVKLNLEWTQLPYQDESLIKEIQGLGNEIARKYENVISLGIGGSFLGLKAAQDALLPSYYNEFPASRKGRPKMYFEGNNLDPDTLYALLKNLNPRKTFVIVISKSGETIETRAAFMVIENWLKKALGIKYGRQIIAITDPEVGSLRKRVEEEQKKDKLSFRSIALLRGVGGRFSEFNAGLLHLAISGIKIQEVLDGAAQMAKQCSEPDIFKNPAYMYAILHTILYQKKDKSIAVIMPFSGALKSTADWYVQLLAESLGKKYARKIEVNAVGMESWLQDKNRVLNVGRTPIAAVGTSDLHSIQQNNIEGENNKVITFIRIEKFKKEIKIPGREDILANKDFSELMNLAQEATEWALAQEERPNLSIIMPCISPFYWGALLFFFEIATAFEGELLDVNAFDQPGVEGYKNYIYHQLGKTGISEGISWEINSHPLIKKSKFIL